MPADSKVEMNLMEATLSKKRQLVGQKWFKTFEDNFCDMFFNLRLIKSKQFSHPDENIKKLKDIFGSKIIFLYFC